MPLLLLSNGVFVWVSVSQTVSSMVPVYIYINEHYGLYRCGPVEKVEYVSVPLDEYKCVCTRRRTMLPLSFLSLGLCVCVWECILYYTWINSSIKKVGNISKVKPWCGIRKGARLMCTRPLSSAYTYTGECIAVHKPTHNPSNACRCAARWRAATTTTATRAEWRFVYYFMYYRTAHQLLYRSVLCICISDTCCYESKRENCQNQIQFNDKDKT